MGKKNYTKAFADLKAAWASIYNEIQVLKGKDGVPLNQMETAILLKRRHYDSLEETLAKIKSKATEIRQFNYSQLQLLDDAAFILGESEPFWFAKYHPDFAKKLEELERDKLPDFGDLSLDTKVDLVLFKVTEIEKRQK